MASPSDSCPAVAMGADSPLDPDLHRHLPPAGDAWAEPDSPSAGFRSPARSLGANMATLATSQVITWTVTLMWTLVVPRLLGPEAIGMLVIATSVTSVTAVVVGVTTRDFLVREMVAHASGARALLRTALVTRAAVVPVLFLAVHGYGRMAGFEGGSMTVLYLMAGATACVVLMEPALASFQAAQRMQHIAFTDVANKSLTALGGVVLALAGYGVVAIAGLTFLVAAAALCYALWWAHRLVGLGARRAPASAVLGRARPYWVVSVLFTAYVWADGIFLGLLAPTEVVGWYGAATRLFTTVGFFAVIVTTASLPKMIAAHAAGPDRMFAVARQPFEWVVLAGLPLGVGMACTADELVSFLYGPGYEPSVLPLVILSLGLPLTYINIVANQIFVASARPRLGAWLLAIAAVFNISLNLVLIPLAQERWGNGAIGAAASLLLTEILQVCLSMVVIGRGLLGAATLVRVALGAVATAGMAAVVMMADAAPLPVQVVLGVATFAGLIVLLRVPTTSEWEVARRGMQRLRSCSRISPREDLADDEPI